jgi:hypothetical protein
MKKLLAILLAMMLAMVSVVAFAEKPDTEEETTDPYNGKLDVTLQLPKSFKATHGTAPAETFTFKFDPVSYTSPEDLVAKKDSTSTDPDDIPAVANVQVSFAKGDETTTKNVNVTLPMTEYVYGRYIYKVTEVVPSPKTAGITYAESKEMYMVVTVLSNGTTGKHFVAVLHEDSLSGEKVDRLFENTYDAGELTVQKLITGNMADLSDTFDFTITFTAASGTAISAAQKEAITVTGGENGQWAATGLVYTLTLGNGDTVSFANLPAGTTYEVAEDSKDYTKTENVTKADGEIKGGDKDEYIVTNTREIEIDTGVNLETGAYMLIMALTLVGFAVMAIRRREEY